MTARAQSWMIREKAFAAFATGPLLDFWRTRQELSFIGVDDVPVHYARFSAAHHQSVILLCPGRSESYVKYPELAYDLFHCGHDVVIIDHRGQGRSGRLLADSHRGHVVTFSDYVDDLEILWQREIASRAYRHKFALAHSMGGAVMTLLLMRQPEAFTAVSLTAPMFGILLPMPRWLAVRILNFAAKFPVLDNRYALGTGRWQPESFAFNVLTHSRERYRRNLRFFADDPGLRIGGPTYHWVHESMQAGEEILRNAEKVTTPLLLLQAQNERVVDNRAQDLFCQMMQEAGHPCEGGAGVIINGARHEILFESDPMRAAALNTIITYFDRFR